MGQLDMQKACEVMSRIDGCVATAYALISMIHSTNPVKQISIARISDMLHEIMELLPEIKPEGF